MATTEMQMGLTKKQKAEVARIALKRERGAYNRHNANKSGNKLNSYKDEYSHKRRFRCSVINRRHICPK